MKQAVGMLELNGLASGIQAADVMCKTADVELIEARVLCPGKYVIIVAGDVSAVQSAVETGTNNFAADVMGSVVLANIHPDVFQALRGVVEVRKLQALGFIECFSVVTAIRSADAAAKAAVVQLLEVRLARGMGGKAFVLLTGDIGAVKAAVDAGVREAVNDGLLAGTAVIPNPDPQVWERML